MLETIWDMFYNLPALVDITLECFCTFLELFGHVLDFFGKLGRILQMFGFALENAKMHEDQETFKTIPRTFQDIFSRIKQLSQTLRQQNMFLDLSGSHFFSSTNL